MSVWSVYISFFKVSKPIEVFKLRFLDLHSTHYGPEMINIASSTELNNDFRAKRKKIVEREEKIQLLHSD